MGVEGFSASDGDGEVSGERSASTAGGFSITDGFSTTGGAEVVAETGNGAAAVMTSSLTSSLAAGALASISTHGSLLTDSEGSSAWEGGAWEGSSAWVGGASADAATASSGSCV